MTLKEHPNLQTWTKETKMLTNLLYSETHPQIILFMNELEKNKVSEI